MRHALENNLKPSKSNRRAFTLVELLIVIVVIGILMSLVLPAVMSGMQRARIQQVVSEIRGLESAIAQFKAIYGVEPPSRIRLYNTAAGWSTPMTGTFTLNGVTLSHEGERTRSIAIINRLWPNYNFSLTHNFGSNSYTDLSGAECLVFFLGGVGTGGSGAYAMTGFSKNPADPFANATGTETREGPFFEFNPGRLRPSLNPTNATTALVYFDPSSGQSAPYVYASSYDGKGYQPADLYVGTADDLNDVYRSTTGANGIPHKAKSFQIVAPGADGLYGAGGYFSTTVSSTQGLTSRVDYDNITNFHGGLLHQ